jgi:hypothetical protein
MGVNIFVDMGMSEHQKTHTCIRTAGENVKPVAGNVSAAIGRRLAQQGTTNENG